VRAHPCYIDLRNTIWEMLKPNLTQEALGEAVYEPTR
jgi:hypothetical protein